MLVMMYILQLIRKHPRFPDAKLRIDLLYRKGFCQQAVFIHRRIVNQRWHMMSYNNDIPLFFCEKRFLKKAQTRFMKNGKSVGSKFSTLLGE